MKKILIFGGSGFIGQNLINEFSKNHKIIATYYKNKPKFKFKNTKWVKLNLINKKSLKKVLGNYDYVFICSAITSGAKNIVSKPEIFVSDNSIINTNIISQIYGLKIKHIFFFSCSVMYQNSNIPKKEYQFNLDKCEKKYFGGAAMKIYTENLCKFFSSISKAKFTVLRHTNTYGPFDKFNKKEGHFFCSSISKVAKSKKYVEVWGKGLEKRNFIYIDDLIDAIKILIRKQKIKYEILNIGSNKSFSINYVVNKIINIHNKKLFVKHNLEAPNIKVNISVDSSKIKSKYKWYPKTSLEKGIRKTLQWYNKNVI
tara:strand:- start:165 stop:1103 length:939 start_codon:yes stop_codon:yes gene_type:complete